MLARKAYALNTLDGRMNFLDKDLQAGAQMLCTCCYVWDVFNNVRKRLRARGWLLCASADLLCTQSSIVACLYLYFHPL